MNYAMLKKMRKNKGNKGFTLVELIVVIAILAILAIGAIAAFSGIQQNAARASLNSDARLLAEALNNFNFSTTAATRINTTAQLTAASTPVSTVQLTTTPTPGSALGAFNFTVTFPDDLRANLVRSAVAPPATPDGLWTVRTTAIAAWNTTDLTLAP